MAMISAKAFQERLRTRQTAPQGAWLCSSCNVPLQESITGCRKLHNGKYVCSDCYFRELGDALDEYPIMTPRVRRS